MKLTTAEKQIIIESLEYTLEYGTSFSTDKDCNELKKIIKKLTK